MGYKFSILRSSHFIIRKNQFLRDDLLRRQSYKIIRRVQIQPCIEIGFEIVDLSTGKHGRVNRVCRPEIQLSAVQAQIREARTETGGERCTDTYRNMIGIRNISSKGV